MSRDERQRGFDSASYLSDDLYRLNQIAINGTNQEYHHDPSSSRHSHIGLLYANQAEQFAGVIPLIRDGLNRGERCYYVYDDNTKADVVAAMREAGIDVKMATETGALSFHTPEELFLQEGVFDLETTIANTKETIREAIEDEGYDGIRMSGEMSWVLDREHSLDRMIKYEQTLNSLYENQPVIGICQYNVKRFDPEIINQLIRSHPNFVFGEEAARHFYYIPHEGVGSTVAPETINDDRSIYSFFERIQAYETLEQRERGLHALNEATQELMFLDGEEIAKRAPDIIRDMLGVSFASFYSYDEDSGDLKCRRSSIAAADGFNSGFSEQYLDRAWKVFVTETPDILDDLPPSTNSDGTETSPRSGVIVPLGRHGVFCTCSTHPNAFDNPTVNLAETVGANIEAALDRADRERTLQKKRTTGSAQ
ncbi:MEDS domain-containing protein [Haladaptatus pallidirubidus]|uniref:MEDS domain-containing protein n=1 Tax=Haladaptatus pallidirubidus TaxID=1008152 RepID=UPI0035E59114